MDFKISKPMKLEHENNNEIYIIRVPSDGTVSACSAPAKGLLTNLI
jgi:hypothetical protein